MQKILVAAPTYNGIKYCHKEFFQRIKNLTYPNYEILIVENSKDNNYYEELKKENITLIKDNTKETKNLLRLINSRNIILNYALKNNYNHILMMDTDVIPPKNIIEELLETKKNIVSGLYFNYFKVSGKLQLLPVAWKSITKEEFQKIKQKIKLPECVKSHLDIKQHLTNKEVHSNKLIKVLFPSAGCMLISRKVFEKIKYETTDTSDIGNIKTTDEIEFILKAKKLGFDSYCHTKLKCKHLIKEKLKQGKHPVYK